ncbi:hypothetical protein N1851_012356 [Merluccius polli]|uniref:Uncharacterized protein n=1 Tax=Merluccius polli TaxID=89951 RepID=A0AA47MWT1_MERPO|nr:hypothetical protein N1851_012356 [Merluccius polli]
MAKTLAVKHGLSQMTAGLPDIIVGAIKGRFAATLNSKDALLAAASLPKLCWPDATTDSNAPISVEIEVMDYLISAPTSTSCQEFKKSHSAITPQHHPAHQSKDFSISGVLCSPQNETVSLMDAFSGFT